MTEERRQKKRQANREWQARKRRDDPAWLEERRRYNRALMRRKRHGMAAVGLTDHLKTEIATTAICECGRIPGSCVPCGGVVPVERELT